MAGNFATRIQFGMCFLFTCRCSLFLLGKRTLCGGDSLGWRQCIGFKCSVAVGNVIVKLFNLSRCRVLRGGMDCWVFFDSACFVLQAASLRSAPSSNRRGPDSLRLLKGVGVVSGTACQCGGSLRRRRRGKTVAPHWVGAGPWWLLVVRRRSCVVARLVVGRLPRCRPGRRGLPARR